MRDSLAFEEPDRRAMDREAKGSYELALLRRCGRLSGVFKSLTCVISARL